MTKEPAIERGVPLPPQAQHGSKECKYIWPKLKAGDTVWYPFKSRNELSSIRTAARSWFKYHKPHLKVSTRLEDKGKQVGVRIWIKRVK